MSGVISNLIPGHKDNLTIKRSYCRLGSRPAWWFLPSLLWTPPGPSVCILAYTGCRSVANVRRYTKHQDLVMNGRLNFKSLTLSAPIRKEWGPDLTLWGGAWAKAVSSISVEGEKEGDSEGGTLGEEGGVVERE